jgi:two-component system cell cycle response regulator
MSLCERLGFDADAIAKRLALTGLGSGICSVHSGPLQDLVIGPNADAIVDTLVATLSEDPGFTDIVAEHSHPERLKALLKSYLLSLGRDCCNAAYFERRLHIGAVHNLVDVPLGRYQCAYRLLQSLLIDAIPDSIRSNPDAWQEMIQFILKITALDMSLAIETFHGDKLANAEALLMTDSLTGVHSRRSAISELGRRLRRAQCDGHALCAIMADLDHFKLVNDNHGHLSGDETLRIAARRLAGCAREGDIIGRYGGEEFLIVLENTSLQQACRLAERMRRAVAKDPVHAGDHTVSITISMGIAEATGADNAESLIDRADRMMYAAKSGGRDCVHA